MKIKGSAGLSIKNIGIISIAVYVLLTALRIYQTFTMIDGQTGFFTVDNFSVPLMYILAVVPVILMIAMCFVCGDLPAGDINKKASVPAGIISAVFGISLLLDGISSLKTVLANGMGTEYAKELTGGNLGMVAMVFAFLGALALAVQSIFAFRGASLPSFMKLPVLFPVGWAFAKTLAFFSITVSYVKVSQLLLSIFASVFLMLFLFENARITADVEKKNSVWFFYATGIITAGLSFAASVPLLLASLFAPEKECIYCGFELYMLLGGIYAVSQLIFRSATIVETSVIENESLVTEDGTETE